MSVRTDESVVDQIGLLKPMRSEMKESTFHIPVKLYRIGELVSSTPFSRQTIHNYTIMGLIQEAKWTDGGHRLYDESVFTRLSRILQLRKTKTLAEIREILRSEQVGAGNTVDGDLAT